MIPERARRAHPVVPLIRTLVGRGIGDRARSVSPRRWSPALAWIDGRAIGVIANNTMVMAGDHRAAADKAARFLQLCDTYDIPVVSRRTVRATWSDRPSEAESLVRRVTAAGGRCGAACSVDRDHPGRGYGPSGRRR